MALPIDYFQPETFAQANPFIAGFGAGQDLIGQGLQNQGAQYANQIASVNAQYAQPMAQQNLLNSQLNNQILQPQAQYAPQMTLADLALKQEMPKYYGALSGEAGSRAAMNFAQTNILKQQTPYLVQKAQADVYSDPMLTRANQMAMAQQAAQSNPNLAQGLGMMGLGNQGGFGGQQMPMASPAAMGAGMSTGMMQPRIQPNTMNAPRMMSGNPMQNYLMFGSPLSPYMQMQLQAYGKGLDTQQTAQANDYSKQLDEASQSAKTSNQISTIVKQFQDGYQNTNLVGAALGHIPAITNEAQQTDNAARQLQALSAKDLNPAKLTNQELSFAGSLKPSRDMNPGAAKMLSDFWMQKSLRMQEEQQFLNTAKNSGVDVYTANSLWNKYSNQRPYYDFSNKTPNPQYQNTWKDFLTPQAIQAAQMGQPYVSAPQFINSTERKNWFKTLNSGDQKQYLQQLGAK